MNARHVSAAWPGHEARGQQPAGCSGFAEGWSRCRGCLRCTRRGPWRGRGGFLFAVRCCRVPASLNGVLVAFIQHLLHPFKYLEADQGWLLAGVLDAPVRDYAEVELRDA